MADVSLQMNAAWLSMFGRPGGAGRALVGDACVVGAAVMRSTVGHATCRCAVVSAGITCSIGPGRASRSAGVGDLVDTAPPRSTAGARDCTVDLTLLSD